MKKLIWKIRYVLRIRKLLLMSLRDAWDCADSSLENVDYDLSECPLDMAYEEYNACMQDA